MMITIDHNNADIYLHAYADNELPEEERLQIEARLAKDAALREQLEQIRQLKQSVHSALQEIDDAPAEGSSFTTQDEFSAQDSVAEDDSNTGQRSLAKFPYSIAAAILVAVSMAALGTWYYQSSPESSVKLAGQESPFWVQQMANYQSMYTLDTLAPVKSDDKSRADLQNRIQANVSNNFSIPSLDEVGLEYKRGQFLSSREQTVVQLAYLKTGSDASPQPVAVCFTSKKESGLPPGNEAILGAFEQLNYLAWHTGELEIAVMGNLEVSELETIKNAVSASLLNANGG